VAGGFFPAISAEEFALIMRVFRNSDKVGIDSGLVTALFLVVWVFEVPWGVSRLQELASV
jgi:hypothetical protein